MEYFVGSIVTLVVVYVVLKNTRINVHKNAKKKVNFKYNQSRSYELIKPFMPILEMLTPKQPLKTQASNYAIKDTVRVLIYESLAYWIKDNSVWKAEIDGRQILKETAIRVDTMGMSKVELDKMVFIIEKLTEGASNDNSNPGK